MPEDEEVDSDGDPVRPPLTTNRIGLKSRNGGRGRNPCAHMRTSCVLVCAE